VIDPLSEIRRVARQVRADFVPDPRVEVFEVRTRRGDGPIAVRGATTIAAAERAFRQRLDEAGVEARIEITILPDPDLAPRCEALVRAPVAPVYRRPALSATQITQYVMGARVSLLSARGRFFRVRGEDAHVGWVHRGYLTRGELPWALAWEQGGQGQPVVSLGAEVQDQAEHIFARLPWGARVIQQAGGRIHLPDGRAGTLARGEVVAVDRLWDRFPARGESIARTARRWSGAPYLWGGITPHGVDCSGLVQSVFWIHGIAMPRDSDMQAHVGAAIDPGPDFHDLRPGDLVFFAERERVNHVAIALGGSQIIHASASNGIVDVNDLVGDSPVDSFLRRILAGARRVLPD
jgi:gamma-D-glutamyl-L-lysine dipeptidyl-peptidase